MKVLFAVSDENISESIVKEYQKQYKEILSYKNVYYFNAIIKELQKDKSYDRIIISEDLEPFASNNYDSIDKFIFEKLDSISDEAIDPTGKETQIILITTERRNFGDAMLVKFFGIGIYSALVGQDKSIENVCKLIRNPRTKKEAKQYYRIDADDVNYKVENENDVSETEIQNILSHYKKLGKSTEKYTDSFNNIAAQYNDEQLKIIINFLPISVKAVLEEESPKYQQLVMSATNTKQRKPNTTEYVPKKVESYKKKDKSQSMANTDPDSIRIDMLENRINNQGMKRNVVIPTEIEAKPIRKVVTEVPKENKPNPVTVNIEKNEESKKANVKQTVKEPKIVNSKPTKKATTEETKDVSQPKKGRGRPRKNPVVVKTEDVSQPKRGRGRPKKSVEEDVNLFELEEQEKPKNIEKDVDLFNLDETNQQQEENVDLFNLDETNQQPDENVDLFNLDEQSEDVNLFGLEDSNESENRKEDIRQRMSEEYNNAILQQQRNTNIDLSNLLTKDKKVVSFVGTTKNGTSFIVNNLAELFSSMGISTAILDMTQSRNAYYIYTNNDEKLRKVADVCINNLRSNIAEGIKVNKNLTVYTAIPGTNQDIDDAENILSTLLQNYSLVLIDCDFNTPVQYFQSSQEIYLVQSMDVLTIQPLTSFLRDLKNKITLNEQKLKIIINKEQKVGGLSPKVVIGGMAFYNDPSMSFMTELFDRTKINYISIPFEVQNYSAYLEALVNCNITLKQYTKQFNAKLKELANMVYPLIGQQYGKNTFANKRY